MERGKNCRGRKFLDKIVPFCKGYVRRYLRFFYYLYPLAARLGPGGGQKIIHLLPPYSQSLQSQHLDALLHWTQTGDMLPLNRVILVVLVLCSRRPPVMPDVSLPTMIRSRGSCVEKAKKTGRASAQLQQAHFSMHDPHFFQRGEYSTRRGLA